MFPYALLLWALLFPRALIVTELETSFLSSWVYHLLHPGERRKRRSRTGIDQKQKGKGRRQKKCFLKKWGGGKISRSLSCTYNTKWRKFVLEGKSWGTWPSSPRVGVGGQWQQLPGVGCWSVKKCHDGAVRRQPLGARAQCAVTVGAVCWGVGKEVIS